MKNTELNKTRESGKYKSIFKSTFLFGFIQIINILAKVILNKAAALFLGVEGIGIMGLFQSAVSILRTGCDLGVSQSAVRDVSEANALNDQKRVLRIVGIINRVIWMTALLGAVLTICLAPIFSKISFGDYTYTYPFIFLAVVVFASIMSESQLAIIKGLRKLKIYAKINLYGSLIGVALALPCYYFLGKQGIVPSLIISSCVLLFLSYYYVSKNVHQKQIVSGREVLKESKQMITMGLALMYVSFLGVFSDYIIRVFIGFQSNIDVVGLFQSASIIISAYFGVIIISLTSDYYPRISAIHKDNDKLSLELNKQIEVSLLLVGVLVVLFLLAIKLLILFLYTESFMPAIDYLKYAVLGVLFTVCSNAVGMILLAKQASKTFFFTATVGRIIVLGCSFIGFYLGGLKGLGIATVFTSIFHLLFMIIIVNYKYKITINKSIFLQIFILLLLSILSLVIMDIANIHLQITLGAGTLIMACVYLCYKMGKMFNMNVIKYAYLFLIKK